MCRLTIILIKKNNKNNKNNSKYNNNFVNININ